MWLQSFGSGKCDKIGVMGLGGEDDRGAGNYTGSWHITQLMHPRSQTTELLLLVLCLVMFDIRVLEDTVYKRLLGAGFKLRYLSLFLCMQLIRFACLTRHIGLKQIAAFMCPSSVVHANSKQFNRQVQVRGTDQRGNKKKKSHMNQCTG